MTDLENICKAFEQAKLEFSLNAVFDCTELNMSVDYNCSNDSLGMVVLEFETDGKFRKTVVY